MKRAYAALMAGALIFTATGCSVDVSDRVVTIGDNPTVKAYIQITQDEAKALMDSGENIAIVDVRRQNEYDEGHIPNAILIPNETIHREPPKELPDFEHLSGRNHLKVSIFITAPKTQSMQLCGKAW